MFRIFYAESDATVYEEFDLYNTGLDEVLEVGKKLGNDGETLEKSRSLLKFNMSEIQSTLTKYSIPLSSCKFVLQLFTTHAKNLPSDYTIDAKIVAQPWINGLGMSTAVKSDTGITWAQPHASWSYDNLSGANWISSSQNIQVNSSSLYVSG